MPFLDNLANFQPKPMVLHRNFSNFVKFGKFRPSSKTVDSLPSMFMCIPEKVCPQEDQQLWCYIKMYFETKFPHLLLTNCQIVYLAIFTKRKK